MVGKPVDQRAREVARSLGLADGHLAGDARHARQYGCVLARMAAASREAGFRHPAFLFGEVLLRVRSDGLQHPRHLFGGGRKEAADQVHELFVDHVHRLPAEPELVSPGEEGGRGGGGVHGSNLLR
ncbi:hypothetical protein D3C71_1581360 [compost metagenome]